ncbi:MAG: DUF4234 domain-containing protein [Dehalococcoidia bacterium]
MAQDATMRRYDHIKYRNMFLRVLAYIFTLGIYGIYWYYATLKELHIANGTPEKSSVLWTLLFFVPFGGFFSLWHHASEYSSFVSEKYSNIVMFILWLVIYPVAWFLVQRDLNRAGRFSG